MPEKPIRKAVQKVNEVQQNISKAGGKMREKLKFIKLYGGWILSGIILLGLILTIIFSVNARNRDREEYRDTIVLERMRIEDTLAKYERSIQSVYENERMRDLYVSYGQEIIRNYYVSNRVAQQRQMTPAEKVIFLEEIYNKAASGIYPNAGMPEGLFLPLAFALVETGFVVFNSDGRTPTTGRDGERSVFQFMDGTAREMYRRNGRSYITDWWRHPREYVWLWFEYYSRVESVRFPTDDFERHVRYSALAYNAGGGRRGLQWAFDQGWTVQQYLRNYPLRQGNENYHNEIWNAYSRFRNGFGAIPLD